MAVRISQLSCSIILVMMMQTRAADFARDVYPIFQRACVECHGAEKHKGSLRLDQRAEASKGGESGKTIVAGKPDESELIRRVLRPRDDEEAMPPHGSALSKREVKSLREWIASGAVWPEKMEAVQHWAYVKPARPAAPALPDWPAETRKRWSASAVDAFIAARVAEEGLKPSLEAGAATLARRLSFDLIGLPPAPELVASFVNDKSADAYERLVDKLLASDEFGVKWARPWLDLARYADSHGFQRDDLREVWAYRDWVVKALNADMPFDQFTIEQVAGDLLPSATEDQLIATGFHRCTPTNVEAGTEPEESRINQVIDRVNTTGAVWLGTTLECAQCHNHKYDPFTQRDYYGLLAYFNNTEKEADRSNPKTPGSIRFLGPSMKLARDTRAAERKSLTAEMQELEKQLATQKPAAEKPAKGKGTKADAAPPSELDQRKIQLQKRIDALEADSTLVMKELPEPRMTTIFQRGEYTQPGAAVTAATPAVLKPSGEGAPTRLTLARWLVSRDNPLTARVTVNRWWAELFGHGIVTTAEDFGIKGEPPTHPELLDWLAVEFMENGWSMKKLIKTIVMSAAYRQSSSVTSELFALDDRNLLYARGPRLRLDAEAVRDNALSIAGLLSTGKGGSPIRPLQPDGLWKKVGGQQYDYKTSTGEQLHRRGLYVVLKRGSPYPSFVNFDASARMACVVKRSRSNTPLQALTLLNDPVYVEAAMGFAKRLLMESPSTAAAERIEHAFHLALARDATAAEMHVLAELYEKQLAQRTKESASAKKLIGKFTVPENTPPAEFASWYAVASALLNLDETITKN